MNRLESFAIVRTWTQCYHLYFPEKGISAGPSFKEKEVDGLPLFPIEKTKVISGLSVPMRANAINIERKVDTKRFLTRCGVCRSKLVMLNRPKDCVCERLFHARTTCLRIPKEGNNHEYKIL